MICLVQEEAARASVRFCGLMLTYWTETWAMKAENLHSLERAERMMVRWLRGGSLKNRWCSVDLYIVLGVQSVG